MIRISIICLFLVRFKNMLIKKSLSNCYNVMLYFVLTYLFAGTLKYKPFVNLSIIILLFISYKGIKLTLKWIFPFFLVILVILPCLELEIEMYIFFHILIKVEISLLYKLLSYYSIKLIIKLWFPIFIWWFRWIRCALNLKVKS